MMSSSKLSEPTRPRFPNPTTLQQHLPIGILEPASLVNMPSSKGKPTDPKLREEIKESS